MLQVHGFPKVMGVLTHLDGFKDQKKLKKTKKALKHRFWAEIYQGIRSIHPTCLQCDMCVVQCSQGHVYMIILLVWMMNAAANFLLACGCVVCSKPSQGRLCLQSHQCI